MLTNAVSQLLFYRPRANRTNYFISFLAVGLVVAIEVLVVGEGLTYLGMLWGLFLAVLASVLLGGIYSGLTAIALTLVFLLGFTLIEAPVRTSATREIQTLVFIVTSFITCYVINAVKSTYQITISILNSLQSLTFILNPKGHIVDVNQAVLGTFGLKRSALVGRTIWTDIGISCSEGVKKKIKTAVFEARQGRHARFDIRCQTGEGKTFHIDLSVSPIYDRQHNVISVVMSGSDISLRVQSEKKALKLNQTLQESQKRFTGLLNSNLIGVLVARLDRTGAILEANDALCAMIGYTQAEIKSGKISWRDLTPPEFADRDKAAIREMFREGETKPYEKEYVRRDGTRLPILIGAALVEPEERICVAFILDITARKKLEKRKDEFIGLASHELKTPLTSLKVFTQLLQRSLTKTQSVQGVQYIDKMNRQIDRLTTLVEELLDVSKIEAGQLQLNLESVNLEQLVTDTVSEIQAITDHTLVVKGSVTKKSSSDVFRVKQVLINLLTNAIKYSSPKTQIAVTLTEEKNQTVVSVTDEGLGIPELDQKRIFEKFFRASGKNKHSFPGLGLGLYLSKRIIERHGGKIWLSSIEGKGSTFSFSLPRKNKVHA